MARYIVIDNVSGHIVGDTSTIDPSNTAYDHPFSACRDVDDERGIHNMVYREQIRPFSSGEPGYFVFQATNEDGRHLVPATTEPDDPHQIKLVWKKCPPPFEVWFIEEDE
jgi:hypothetical protein